MNKFTRIAVMVALSLGMAGFLTVEYRQHQADNAEQAAINAEINKMNAGFVAHPVDMTDTGRQRREEQAEAVQRAAKAAEFCERNDCTASLTEAPQTYAYTGESWHGSGGGMHFNGYGENMQP